MFLDKVIDVLLGNKYDLNGFDKYGYNRLGFDKYGYDRLGFDKYGYNRAGHDRQGYDRRGLDKQGYDRSGFDSNGYNLYGFDRSGYSKEGYNRNGFNIDGFDKQGFNKEGFNKYGYDNDGYDINGFNSTGYNRDGLDKEGFDKSGFNSCGYNREGFDKEGFDKNGYNKNGYDKSGYDKDGFSSEGINRQGFSRAELIKQQAKIFNDASEKYSNKLEDSAANLAICYLKGIGAERNLDKALNLIIEGAYDYSIKALLLLSDCYYCGYGIPNDTNLSRYVNEIAKGKNPPPIYKYKAMAPTTFKAKSEIQELAYKTEKAHLGNVVNSISNKISALRSGIKHIETETYWMDEDQRNDWVEQRYFNKNKFQEIYYFEQIKQRPFYARMDSILDGIKQSYYIGEEVYNDFGKPENNIYSVWSEYGQKYRAKNELTFNINGYKYEVTLRRRFDIVNSELIEIFDDYVIDSEASNAQITDPYLIRVLEEKKGEKNITNIIRSIQLNQNDIIEYDFNKNLIVQGCAGSGKTMILLHRLANMKYNIKNLDLSSIKIITPNKQFNLFIDELSQNLRLEEISKCTMGEYYISLLGRYRHDNQELYKKRIMEKNNNGDKIEQLVNAYRKTGPTEAMELEALSNDNELSSDIVRIIYSDKFTSIIEREGHKLRESSIEKKHYGLVISHFSESFNLALSEAGIELRYIKNYNCVLYAKLLYVFSYYGGIIKTDYLLCIDEGQDISELQYILIYKVNRYNTLFNIYGDIVQLIPTTVGIVSWSRIESLFKAKYFVLNENYRNSDDIITFYNGRLDMNNKSFGLKTKPIEIIKLSKLAMYIKLQIILKNRTAVICNNLSLIPKEVKELCEEGVIANNKASLLNVIASKGLEYDTVFVIHKGMDRNEKYISYSRALSELYIVEFED